MLLGKRTRRIIAATLLTVMLTDTIAPTVTYALTSGPTAPEANSFEPVDTSDMVNLLSGDLTYNIPLLEVPGPEGGYPLALSYHAGVQPNIDASWVGLGWSLNPGAITRDVSGYPDDYSNIKMTRRDFWNGGTTTTYQFGVSVGLAGSPASVNFGLSVANDTYKGFGVGVDAGVGISYGPVGMGASIGINPYGGAYATAGVSIGTGVPIGSNMALGLSGSFSISTNFESIDGGFSANGGLSYSHAMEGYDKPLTHSVLGISIASNGTKPSLSVGGATASSGNVNSGRIQTSSSGFGFGIPITPIFGVYLGRKKVRYWSDETLDVFTNGSLHMEFAPPDPSQGGGSGSGFKNHAYDVYHLHDNAHYNIGANPDARVALGGSFPDNDYYNVTAQGLGGNIRPYAFQEELYIQHDKLENNKVIKQWMPPHGSADDPIHYVNPQFIQYRFVNDFSNRFVQTQQSFVYPGNWVKPAFHSNPVRGKNGNDGYDPTNQILPGSRNIEYIYNVNMLPGMSHTGLAGSKFYDPVCPGFVRKGIINGGTELDHSFNYQIGGFQITNESGVTYHYMLPAYTGSEYVYSRQKGNDGNFNMQKKDGSYAYAWYLTGLTGPDYVDTNNDGVINEGDWGYWVSFEFGKWTDDYVWRNPEQGFHGDIDNAFETQSAGKKELYYLNRIRTATHSAIFEKALRLDGKGISSTTYNSPYGNYPLYNGGFDATTSRGTASLQRILIMKNEDGNALSTSAGQLPTLMYYNNIFDPTDIPASASEKFIRSIEFNYDYSLCPGTVNSYDYSNVNAKQGKLTLKSLLFKGKKGVSVLPAIQFNYDPDGAASSSVTTAGNKLNFTGQAAFKVGDIVRFSAGATYYAVILKVNGSDYDVKYIDATPPGSGIATTAVVTKNPPYSKDNYDMWNLYKSDYDAARQSVLGENAGRMTSEVSSKGTDVWSLHSVTTSLGAKINIDYEGDQYSKAVLEQGYRLQMYDYPNPNFYFNSNTDNRFYYVVRNKDVFDRSAFYIGARFDAILHWTRWGSGACNVAFDYHAIDTKVQPDCYLEIVDLGRFDNEGIIGFKFNNVFALGYPWVINSFPYGCFRMPEVGNIRLHSSFKQWGGNLRVKSIAVLNTTDNRIQRTVYEYNQPGTSTSSGITSYEPSIMDVVDFVRPNASGPPTNVGTDESKKAVKAKLYTYNSQVMSFTRELPPPGVMYEYVSIQNEVINPESSIPRPVEGKTTYQFEVFNENMVGVKELQQSGPVSYPGTSSSFNTLETRHVALKNFTTRLGNVKRIIHYDDKGKKLSETINNYLHDNIAGQSFLDFDNNYQTLLQQPQIKQQGIVQENFVQIREQNNANDAGFGQVKAVNAQREEYPAIMTKQTTIDYVHNTTAWSQNIEYDFYSGALLKKLDVDAYGNRFMSEIVPAYNIYPQMGMKFYGSFNKNMLVQEAARYMYKVDNSNNKMGLINASAQTWSRSVDVINPSLGIIKQDGTGGNGNVWRKQSSYDWMPFGKTSDGITSIGSFTDFNWSNPDGSSGWTKTSELTLYDTYSHALEVKDINGNYAATKMGYNNSRVLISGGPAKHGELAFSGAEDNLVNGKFGGDISPGNGTAVTTAAHTGHKSLRVTQGQSGFTYILNNDNTKTYSVTVWVRNSNGTNPSSAMLGISRPGFNESFITNSGKNANGWYQIIAFIPTGYTGPITIRCYNNTGGADLMFDDFRIQPWYARTAAFVYDNLSGELTHILDNNNLYTRFEYDAVGRLVKTYREKLNIGEYKVSEYYHNYSAASTIYPNAHKSQPFTRNNCGIDYIGGQVDYIVPGGKHISTLSQPDADALAQADITANGQDYANTVGSCTRIYRNAEKWQIFTRNNCPAGYRGAAVQYIVPYGRYTSTVDQATADAMAQADINANGQNFANQQFNSCYPDGILYASTELENMVYGQENGQQTLTADVVVRFWLDPNRDYNGAAAAGQIFYYNEYVYNYTTNTVTSVPHQMTTDGNYRYVIVTQKLLQGFENGNYISRGYPLQPTAFFWYEVVQ